MRRAFPAAVLAADTGGQDPVLSIEAARRVLGYVPRHTWRR